MFNICHLLWYKEGYIFGIPGYTGIHYFMIDNVEHCKLHRRRRSNLCNITASSFWARHTFSNSDFHTPPAYVWLSELCQPLRSYFGLYRQFTITKAAEDALIWDNQTYQFFLIKEHFKRVEIVKTYEMSSLRAKNCKKYL